MRLRKRILPVKNMHLDEKLNFNHHINEKIAKANKVIGLICKLAHVLPRQLLITIYVLFDLILITVTSFMVGPIMKVFAT